MRKTILLSVWMVACSLCAMAASTLPMSGTRVLPSDSRIRYVGRICWQQPERPTFNLPGVQVIAAFEGTSLRMVAKPGSGYFVAQIDEAAPFKVAFTSPRDSVVSLATALPHGRHLVRLMYCIEGFEFMPEFWGFLLDEGCSLTDAPELPARKIEFIGNSITCGYGNEGTDPNEHFDYATENHYLSYAALTARQLGAQHVAMARSGIGAYRNYGGPKAGTPDSNMPVQYEYTCYAPERAWRQQGGAKAEKWDFSRYQPDVVCINLGTNDLSTNNYDLKLLKQGYQTLLRMVRQHNGKQTKVVFLCGSMLGGKELQQARETLDAVVAEAKKAGDSEVYRFDFTPQNGDLGYGSDWHPSVWQHEKMAGELTAFLRALMHWF